MAQQTMDLRGKEHHYQICLLGGWKRARLEETPKKEQVISTEHNKATKGLGN